MINRDDHFALMESQRTPAGLPVGTFDFISVHGNSGIGRNTFALISPLCIVESIGDKRPDFETLDFPTFDQAVEAAEKFAILYSLQIGRRIFVVDCYNVKEESHGI